MPPKSSPWKSAACWSATGIATPTGRSSWSNESIRCDKAVSNAGDVTFTHEAWNEVHQQMDTKFTDRDIVGWYHSHPNFGIFLSDRDCFIQDHFFNGPGQIAYVVDPVNGVEGVFAWRNGKAKLFPHFWVGDEIHLSSQGAARKPSSASPAGQPSASVPEARGLAAAVVVDDLDSRRSMFSHAGLSAGQQVDGGGPRQHRRGRP